MKNNISQLRKKHSMTQKELADLLKVSRQTIISLERGKYNPSILLAYQISKLFNKTIEEVFVFEEESN
ncbi:helix-turn-helix transcriptional regulator [Rummeliibacillus suwonensis]|uniref:helix-turn-helix transcriptional regulator n=1 Tax=Rummeliibacillus suwonensis TaxID=1306154 RepID=UPI0011B5FF84|nr:helix-turn-helix transcriptional regulator [Rummeliibacillus suwonensis]